MKKFLVIFIIFLLSCGTSVLAKSGKSTSTSDAKPTINDDSGYVGTLPDLEERFRKSREEEATPQFEYDDGFNDPDAIKAIPRNNSAFVNIIMKKDKTSQYINDLNDIIFIIENLQTVVEDKANVQVFNAKAYYLKTNVDYFRDKYKNRSESSFISFRKLMELNNRVQSIAQLRAESEIYTPYVTATGSGNLYSQNTIDVQLDYLLDEIKSTLVVLKAAR